MASFSMRETDGMRQVSIGLADDMVRARRGALQTLRGDVTVFPRLPGPVEFIRSLFNDEARIRPEYRGTGTVVLQPSLAGYHLMDVRAGESWILEPGVYWASEGQVGLGLARDPFLTSFFIGDGFFNWKTRVTGPGVVALHTPGPVETVEITDSVFKAQGRIILGRTAGLRYTTERAARFPRNLIAGQQRLRVLRGTGRILVCFAPHWNEHLYELMTGRTIERSFFE
jgi:uncharacterized protein (AIM24 family)